MYDITTELRMVDAIVVFRKSVNAEYHFAQILSELPGF